MRSIFIAFTLKNSSVSDFFISLANYLSQTYQVILVTHANEKHFLKLNETIKVYQWPTKRPKTLKDLFFLLKLIHQYQPRTLIGNFAAVNLFMLGGFIMGVEHRIAWYHTLTTQLKEKKNLKYRKRFFYQLATKLVANSEAGKLDLQDNFGVHSSKIEVVNNAVVDPNIEGEMIFNNIVFAGRLYKIKGVHVLLKSMKIVKDDFPEIKLIIIGDDEGTGEFEVLKNLQIELGLENNIIFKGNRSRSYVLDQFSKANVTIVPSFFEAFGYVVIESFSVHTPVIGSDTGGIANIITDGDNGLLFKKGDHRDLAEKIIYLLKNRDIRDKMANNCYVHFMENYELKSVVKQLAENPQIFN